MTAEATLRAAVLKRINEDYPRRTSGVLVFGRPAGASTGPGHPDLFGVVVGRFIALEIKVLKAQPSPLQIQRIKDLRQAGAYAWIIRTPLEASKAIYQVKIGAPHPMPEDPIDIDDWFKEIASTPTPNATETAALEAGLPVNDSAEPLPLDVQNTPQDTTLADLPVPSPEALAEMPEAEPAKQRRARRGKYANAVAAPVDIPAEIPTPDADQRLAYLTELIKAVGDRVTLVYEQGNRIEAKLDKLQVDFDTLLEDES